MFLPTFYENNTEGWLAMEKKKKKQKRWWHAAVLRNLELTFFKLIWAWGMVVLLLGAGVGGDYHGRNWKSGSRGEKWLFISHQMTCTNTDWRVDMRLVTGDGGGGSGHNGGNSISRVKISDHNTIRSFHKTWGSFMTGVFFFSLSPFYSTGCH